MEKDFRFGLGLDFIKHKRAMLFCEMFLLVLLCWSTIGLYLLVPFSLLRVITEAINYDHICRTQAYNDRYRFLWPFI